MLFAFLDDSGRSHSGDIHGTRRYLLYVVGLGGKSALYRSTEEKKKTTKIVHEFCSIETNHFAGCTAVTELSKELQNPTKDTSTQAHPPFLTPKVKNDSKNINDL